VIASLEKQMSKMAIDEESADIKKSPIGEALAAGKANVGGAERKIVKAGRKTAGGKAAAEENERQRQKDVALFKATLKSKNEIVKADGDDSDSDWESAEEDFPNVRLEELMDNLKLDDGPELEGAEPIEQDEEVKE